MKFVRKPVARGYARNFWYYLYIQSSRSVSFQGILSDRISQCKLSIVSMVLPY